MEILRTIKEVREFKRANRDAPLVLVPTMERPCMRDILL